MLERKFNSVRLGTAAGVLALLCWPTTAFAAKCYQSSVVSPTPFMGNNDEVFKLSDGSFWQVKYEYEYLYEYYPTVVICPSSGMLLVSGKSLNVVPIRSTANPSGARPANAVTVVYRRRGCDYFIADGPQGYYVLEWYRGHDPDVGDALVGYERGYGFKDVVYINNGSKGRIYAEDYLLSKDRAAEILADKCG